MQDGQKTYHILKPGSRWDTLCGAARTEHDSRYSWHSDPAPDFGQFRLCAECRELKELLQEHKANLERIFAQQKRGHEGGARI